MSPSFDAVILIAHGARDARWIEPFNRMQAELADKLRPLRVAVAFLEFAPPTFADAMADAYRGGARHVLIVPVFLSGGGHVANDLPGIVDAARKRHPDATFAMAGAVGEEPEVRSGMIEAVSRLARGR